MYVQTSPNYVVCIVLLYHIGPKMKKKVQWQIYLLMLVKIERLPYIIDDSKAKIFSEMKAADSRGYLVAEQVLKTQVLGNRSTIEKLVQGMLN